MTAVLYGVELRRPFPSEPTDTGAKFKAQPGIILASLRDELWKIGVLEGNLEGTWDVRSLSRHGEVLSGSRTTSPGLVLTFEHHEQGPLAYPANTYWTWLANVRALALTLEALRAVDRHGCVERGQQYAGFKALPAQSGNLALTPSLAAKAMSDATGGAFPSDLVLSTHAAAVAACRLASSRAHPDAGGQPGAFEAVQEAKRVLAQHFGRPL